MNEQERAIDLQLGDALAEIMKLNVKLTETMKERDEYQVATDKLAMECKVLRDAVPVQKGPVAYARSDTVFGFNGHACLVAMLFPSPSGLKNPIGLYTHPPKREWVGLTDEEQQQAYEQWQNEGWGVFYRAIEDKLKEKNK